MQENPIDKDKVTENPSTLPYAHTVGGFKIAPTEKGKVKGKAMAAMYEQTQEQLDQLKQQADLIMQQAKKLQDRVKVSEMIYEAVIGFEPVIGHTYYLYDKGDENYVVSMVAPDQWGRSKPFKTFVAIVKLLSDHTWDVQFEDNNE